MLASLVGAAVLVKVVRSDCDGCTLSASSLPFMCIDAEGGSSAVGTALDIWNCNGLKNQVWSWKGAAVRYNADTTKCMSAGSLAVDSQLTLQNCNGAAEQQFNLDSNGRITAGTGSKFCLSPAGDAFAPGVKLRLFPCTYYRDQQWSCSQGAGPPPIPVPNFKKPVNIISEAAPSKCLDVPGGKATAGNNIDLWDCVGIAGQSFLFNSDGTLRTSVDNTMCMELTSGVKQGNFIQLAKCSADSKQKFGYDTKMGTVYAAASASDASLCLDIPGGKTDDGAKLWVWACNGLGQQKWFVQNTASADVKAVIV
jgi:hypothetical protein